MWLDSLAGELGLSTNELKERISKFVSEQPDPVVRETYLTQRRISGLESGINPSTKTVSLVFSYLDEFHPEQNLEFKSKYADKLKPRALGSRKLQFTRQLMTEQHRRSRYWKKKSAAVCAEICGWHALVRVGTENRLAIEPIYFSINADLNPVVDFLWLRDARRRPEFYIGNLVVSDFSLIGVATKKSTDRPITPLNMLLSSKAEEAFGNLLRTGALTGVKLEKGSSFHYPFRLIPMNELSEVSPEKEAFLDYFEAWSSNKELRRLSKKIKSILTPVVSHKLVSLRSEN